MCSNYRPVTRQDQLLKWFGVVRDYNEQSPEVDAWPLGLAPFIRLHEDGSGNKVVEEGHFGLLPGIAKELSYGRMTYNARSETVGAKVSFRESWAKGWRCIVPAEWVYEPSYESGKAVRWRVQQPFAVPMGIAGIYRRWRDADGVLRWTFAMLTVNADSHPLYKQLHKPGEEKRMPVILKPEDFDAWLACSPSEAVQFFRQFDGPLEANADALPPRKSKK
jgi:putative SOS response-associated peptidase YedK